MSKAAELAALIGGTSGSSLSNRNLIINGAMQVAQRGTSDTTFGSGYSVDRMFLDQFGQSGDFHTYQQLSSNPPVGFINYLRWQRNSSRTDTGAMRIYYTGETGYSSGIAGNKLTLSFYARKGSNYSGGSLESRIVLGEGTDQSRSNWANGSWTNQVNDSQSNTLTTSWQRFTHTLASPAGNDVSQHAVRFVWTPTGTAGTNDYIEITGIQLEIGETATPFEHRSFGDELARCQRYFEKTYDQGTAVATATATGSIGFRADQSGSTASAYGQIPIRYVVTKRATATVTFYDTAGTSGHWTSAGAVDGARDVAATSSYSTGFTPQMNQTFDLVSGHFTADAEL